MKQILPILNNRSLSPADEAIALIRPHHAPWQQAQGASWAS
jgi:hypothetical protein